MNRSIVDVNNELIENQNMNTINSVHDIPMSQKLSLENLQQGFLHLGKKYQKMIEENDLNEERYSLVQRTVKRDTASYRAIYQ